MAKCAENHRLIIVQFILVEQDFDKRLNLGIIRVEIACLFKQHLDIGSNLIDKTQISICVAVTCFHKFNLVELTSQNIL